ncbi:hypothetical protein V8C86DRAFT_2751226 [Haematococcus lacustris]
MMLSRPGLHCRPSGTRAIHQCCIAGDGAFVAPQPRVAGPGDATRRTLLAIAAIAAFQSRRTDALANVGFTKELKKRRLSPDDYTNNEAVGLPVVELEAGRGQAVKLQDRVVVHYDCIYRGVDVVSSRSARLLGGNRTIAEPYEFVVGQPVLGNQAKKGYEGAGGLFSGSSGPKPPPALSKAVLGMKRGGRRSILVDKPELGYPAGEQEIPDGATFELKVEVLDVFPA